MKNRIVTLMAFGMFLLTMAGNACGTTAPIVGVNNPPIIDALYPENYVVLPQEIVQFFVEAHDPDCPTLAIDGCGQIIQPELTEWVATGGTFLGFDNGLPSSPYSASAIWQAPLEESIYDITVTIFDSGSLLCGGQQSTSQSFSLQVTTEIDQNQDFEPVPEPATMALFGFGLAGMATTRLRRKKKDMTV